MRRFQDEAKQLFLEKIRRGLDNKKEGVKSSFQAWEMEVATHIQTLESVTLKQLVNIKLTAVNLELFLLIITF